MSDNIPTIKSGTSFNSIEAPAAPPLSQEAIDYYQRHLASAIDLEAKLPIFLDTNVLLRGYSVQPGKRELLIRFLSEHKNNIVVTKQIQNEFARNRAAIKESYAQSPEVHLSDLNDQLATLMLSLEEEITAEESTPEAVAKEQDELLILYNGLKKIDNLSSAEKHFLKSEFDELRSKLSKDDLKVKKYNNVFPGVGDVLEKPNFPYGDYFLYHELLKFVIEKKTDVLFLTFDVAKGDWMKTNKEPHLHYIQKTFALTGKLIFIIDANFFFEKLFSTSFDSIVATEKIAPQKLVLKSELEEELSILFSRLERTLRRIARKFKIEESEDTSSKDILDDLNYDDIISDDIYYELTGIWPIRDELIEGDVDIIRRRYTKEELMDVLEIVKGNLRGIGRL